MGSKNCQAQYQTKNKPVKNIFTPREIVVFEDDFSRDHFLYDSINKTVKWYVRIGRHLDDGESNVIEGCNVEKDNDSYYLNITGETELLFQANIERKIFGDSFTIECIFLLGEMKSAIEVQLMNDIAPFPTGCSIQGNGDVHTLTPNWKSNKAKSKYPGIFTLNKWHLFAVSYKKDTAKYYIDNHLVMTMDSCNFSNSTLYFDPKGPLKIRHVRVTAGNISKPFDELLNEKKFVTHAINFEINSSSIWHESLSFLIRLAQFLKENPKIKLEIDGHTDSEGDASANTKLSLERANEVKKQLIENGINSSRLTTRGFGATKPIQSNDTPEGRANNRRVELIKR